MHKAVGAVLAGALLLSNASVLQAQTLRGSSRAMYRQNRVAQQHDYSFLRTSSDVRRFADLGLLVRLSGNSNYALASVSHPYARPAVKLFVERLAGQYRAACGEKLVVTSLTRPEREQPRNASDLSVHPAGMAVDLRISKKRSCRKWLERTLLSLERQGLLEAGRERRPPHYHIALFPEPYQRHVARVGGKPATVRLAAASVTPTRAQRAATTRPQRAATTAPKPAPSVAVAPQPVTSSASAESEASPMPASVAEVTESDETPAEGAEFVASPETEPDVPETTTVTYRTRRGDTLWSIARRHGTTVQTLRTLNGLKSSRLVVGQVITLPTAASADGS